MARGRGAGARPKRQEASVSEFVTVEQADNEAMAEMIQQRLEEEGIPCVVAPSNLGALAQAGARYAINVPADRADEARTLLGE